MACLASHSTKHINLGPTMFDKPNKDAFYIVIRFLLEKLNPTRFHELYRHCWPILNHKADAEFRKVTCTWLKEIMDETANAGSKVVASLFLSPGGPKFVSLMLHLANHVMLQEMKTFTTDGSWVPEAAALPASSLDMAVKRLNLIHTRFLKTAVEQDRFLQEYQRQAQCLVKSMRESRADGAKYDELLKRHSSDLQEQASLVEKAKKVRALWSTIDGALLSTKEEQHAVQCVLKGDVDQYTLDGTDEALKISPCLLERIEQLPHQLSSGNVYEAGQLNLLSVLELANHALQLLKEEQCQVSHCPPAELVPEQLQEKSQQMSRVLQDLYRIRQKISKEEAPEVRAAITEQELEWDRKWMDIHKSIPLVNFLNEEPALGFLSPMAPLSFEPAAEASYKNGIFSQYAAKLLEKPMENPQEEVTTHVNKSTWLAKSESESPVCIAEASSIDWLFDGPPSPKTEQAKVNSIFSNAKVPRITSLRTKTEIIEMECDNLADQLADAITTNSGTPESAKSLDLEELLGTLHRDPFYTRKQLPRTPESLIMDVKNSWRKALEEDKAERLYSPENDSIIGRLTPLGEANNVFQSPQIPTPSAPELTTATDDTPSVYQQGVLLKSSLEWHTFNTETIDSPSGTGSSAVQFNLDHETLPEIPSCNSLLSLDDTDIKSEEEDSPYALPFLKDSQQTLLALSECDEGSFTGKRNGTPECLLSHDVPTLANSLVMEPVKNETPRKMAFSLDLDSLESLSAPKQEYSFPKLITFSPIDDMKC